MANGDDKVKGGTPTHQEDARRIKKRIKEYVGSDIFKQRQEKFVGQEIKKIKDKLGVFSGLFDVGNAEEEATILQDLFKERAENIPQITFTNLRKGLKGAYKQSLRGGNEEILIDEEKTLQEAQRARTLAHEISHSLYDKGFFGSQGIEKTDAFGDKGEYGVLEEKMKELKKKVKDNFKKYATKDSEIRAEVWGERFRIDTILNQIRQYGEVEGFDASEEEMQKVREYIDEINLQSPITNEFKREHIDILKTFAPDSRLPELFEDEELIELMNIVAGKKTDRQTNNLT